MDMGDPTSPPTWAGEAAALTLEPAPVPALATALSPVAEQPAVRAADVEAAPSAATLVPDTPVSSLRARTASGDAELAEPAEPPTEPPPADRPRPRPEPSPPSPSPAPAAKHTAVHKLKRLAQWRPGGKTPGDGDKGGKPPPPPRVPYFQLYRFAGRTEWLLVLLGVLGAIINGSLQPLSLILFGDIINAFGPTATADDLLDAVRTAAIWLTVLGGGALLAGSAEVGGFTWSGLRQANTIRRLYFQAILRQEVGWYDAISTGELTVRIASDINDIQAGISEKAGVVLRYISTFVTSITIGFIFSWKLALTTLAVVPLIAAAAGLMGLVISSYAQRGQEAYAKAGGVADEMLSSIRTVVAFGGEDRATALYRDRLKEAVATGLKRAHFAGLGIGVTFFVLFASYGLAFWVGQVLINNGEISPGRILTVFFAILFSAMGLGQASPNFNAFATAQAAASVVFDTIDRKPAIDSLDASGRQLAKVRGEICFNDVHFSYPTRPDVPILNGLSFTLRPGTTLALVGPSGCGKSTVVSLVQRFYDPARGSITLDGVDIRELNVPHLRSIFGVVSQEPVLFNATIAENIRVGVPDATQADIEEVARQANAHDFIMRLPQGYQTMAGERGAQLSGGQKQRIAIARALLRRPKVLLLDEATSALDTQSERIVQQTLSSVAEGRSTIVIAHRLSTIAQADEIAVVESGRIVERGTHHELLAKGGVYARMVEAQTMRTAQHDAYAAQGDGAPAGVVRLEQAPDDEAPLAAGLAPEAPLGMGAVGEPVEPIDAAEPAEQGGGGGGPRKRKRRHVHVPLKTLRQRRRAKQQAYAPEVDPVQYKGAIKRAYR